jgi:hypothetical protein
MTNPYRVRNSTRGLGTWPSREEILALGAELDERYDVDHGDVELVRAALARWGTPAIEPVAPAPTDEELWKEIERKAFSFSDSEVERCSFICGFFAGLPRPTIQPVAPESGYEKGYAQEHLARLMRDAIGTETNHNVYIVAAGKILDRPEFMHVARYYRPTIEPVS